MSSLISSVLNRVENLISCLIVTIVSSLPYVFQVLEKGMRFTMRDGRSTLGYGVVTELLPEKDLLKYEEQRKKEKKAKKKAEEMG